jgi:hypothetical protein
MCNKKFFGNKLGFFFLKTSLCFVYQTIFEVKMGCGIMDKFSTIDVSVLVYAMQLHSEQNSLT